MWQWKNKASERSQDNKCKEITCLCVIMCDYLQEGPRVNSLKFINVDLLDPGNDSGEEFLPHVSCKEVGRCRFPRAFHRTFAFFEPNSVSGHSSASSRSDWISTGPVTVVIMLSSAFNTKHAAIHSWQ